jgi:hypothetical protein
MDKSGCCKKVPSMPEYRVNALLFLEYPIRPVGDQYSTNGLALMIGVRERYFLLAYGTSSMHVGIEASLRLS